jgi:predicted Zn-dependent protease
MIDSAADRFRSLVADVDYASLRVVDEQTEALSVRQGVLEPSHAFDPRGTKRDTGAMVTVVRGGGLGYAATNDLSATGLGEAFRRARAWAEQTRGRSVADYSQLERAGGRGTFETPVRRPWASTSLGEKVDLLRGECERLKTDDRIVDWWASLHGVDSETLFVDTRDAEVRQRFHMVMPGMGVVAFDGKKPSKRTLHGHGTARQGGLEVLDAFGFTSAAPRLTEEALELLVAPECPTGAMDVLLAPDQMILQIHESIGHPLELDRILGDERNYAGTSFVTMDMFGSYRYGSELLDVVWDPTRPEQLASYGFDDDGTPAQREFVIRKGILLRPLGGTISQQRAGGVEGVATTRASGWNRPPIDRMANLNLEPGDRTLEELVGSVERGVLMETNTSWSIDDSRNKFQFGCEYGRRIEDGELTEVVKKPNYRGISATFWRNLKAVGTPDTVQVMGTPNCGKGEPNQMVRVGHASPTCLFGGVSVFGGA